MGSLCDDGGLLPSEELRQLAELKSDLDQALESILGIPHQLLFVCLCSKVSLNVHPDSSTLAPGTGQPPDDAGSVFESDDLPLVLADTPIDRVSVVEVVSFFDLEAGASRLRLVLTTDERASSDCLLECVNELLSGGGLDLLVIVTGEEGTTVNLVVFQEKIVNTD